MPLNSALSSLYDDALVALQSLRMKYSEDLISDEMLKQQAASLALRAKQEEYKREIGAIQRPVWFPRRKANSTEAIFMGTTIIDGKQAFLTLEWNELDESWLYIQNVKSFFPNADRHPIQIIQLRKESNGLVSLGDEIVLVPKLPIDGKLSEIRMMVTKI